VKVTELELPGVLLVEPRVLRDVRGAFLESWHRERYAAAGIDAAFVQDNVSFSAHGVLRGLHYQYPHPQAKLVMALRGSVFDVAVDVRRGSPSFGRWVGAELTAESGRQLYIPEGLAHGFVVTSPEGAVFAYKCTAPYRQEAEHTIRWDDPVLGIAWPVQNPVLSSRDAAAGTLAELGVGDLPSVPDTDT